jgi:ketosteroid isomerase-like protein
MSQENVETLRQAIDARNRDGWEAMRPFAHPNIEFHEPPEQPGPGMFVGIDAVREALRVWSEAWTEQVTVIDRIIDLDDGRLVCLTTEKLRGRDGIELEQEFAAVVTFREGKFARWDAYWNQATALEAAGLQE